VLSLANGKTVVGEQSVVELEDGSFEATLESGSVTEN
jgi:hypothetical protein